MSTPTMNKSEYVERHATGADYSKEKCFHELFEAQAEKSPSAIALLHEDRTLSYGELNARANRLARHMRKFGVGSEARVAICLERGFEMVVAWLATLKAGGVAVPLDPAYPPDRLSYILEDSAPVLLVTHGAAKAALAHHSSEISILRLDSDDAHWSSESGDNPDRDYIGLDGRHIAYIIYTSGSTGLPKGVMVEHLGLCNSALAQIQAFDVEPDSRLLQFASFSFDACVFEMTLALGRGAALVFPPGNTVSASQAVVETIDRHAMSHAVLPPAVLSALPEGAVLDSVRLLIVGGEAVSREAVQRWSTGRRMINGYGPTETTVWSTYHDCSEAEPGSPPIGGPIVNTRVHILDSQGQPTESGVAGELYIGGAGVTRGYLNRAELTAERFVPDPFGQEPGARLYRTGDLGRWLREGEIEFIGRNDSQVKLRGFRIELGEIEARLACHHSVREAVVLAREDGESGKRLVAYYTGERMGAEALRIHLSSGLPDYMIPSAYVHLKTLPLTRNGKVDRRALPIPASPDYVSHEYQPPVGETETRLARIWAELLKVERVGRNDNFFELGGHSLLVATVIERMRRDELITDVSTLFAAPSLRALAEAVAGGGNNEVDTPPNLIPSRCTAITPEMLPLVKLTQSEIDAIIATVPGGVANVQDIYPLAPLQEGILFHHLMSARGDAYLVQSLLAFDSLARLDDFVTALQAVIARHDILRTAIIWEGLPEPVQVVWKAAPLTIEEVTLDPSGLAAGDAAGQLKARFDPRQIRVDVRHAPLMRGMVAYDAANERWLLLWLSHHLAIDHTTLEIMAHEAQAHVMGEADRLPEPLPFRNFVAQARLRIDRAEHEAFFKAMLGDVEEPTAPFGLVDAQGDGSNINESRMDLDTTLAQRLRTRARAMGVSAASLCHLAWARVLARVSGRDDVVFGTVLFGRMHGGEGADRALGLFINTLPVRIRIAHEGVEQSVRQTHSQLAELMRHEHASLALAQRCSAVAAPAPLFSSLLNCVHSVREAAKSPEASTVKVGVESLEAEERCNYPLTLTVEDLGEGFSLKAQVQSPIDPGRVCEFMRTALERLVEALETAPETPLRSIDATPEFERHTVLVEWNATEADYPSEKCVHELFEEQVEKTPDAVALAHQDERLTYRDLNTRANRLARHLRALGVEPGARVAIILERSIDLVVAELATLKCGAAYLPIDPMYPDERQVFMAFDCGAWVAITTRNATLPTALTIPRVDIDEVSQFQAPGVNLNIQCDSEMTAYVMYTSGSTGLPKGVRVPHRAIGRLVLNCGYADFNSSDAVAFAANPAFDAATMEVWAPLLNGGRIVVIDQNWLLEPGMFGEVLKQEQVSVLWLTAGLFNQYAGTLAKAFGGLRYLIVGGDVLDPGVIARVLESSPPRHLVNGYGPTETTTFAITHEIREVSESGKSVPLGRPIGNTQIYILDLDQEVAPIGVRGEIYIGGAGVSRGYVNRAELTAERFVPDPFSRKSGAFMYRTGDLGQWNADGTIEFLGRSDFQVKVRGFRVELGEIEAKLAAEPRVREAVVLAREDGANGKRLVAYYTGEEIGPEVLRGHLSSELPEYMVPAAYVYLEKLPLTSNGKVDRKALPAPEGDAYVRRGYEAPVTETEIRLAQIWAAVLKVERVSRNDNFFELGGHSLLAVQVLSRLRQTLAVEVSMGDLFAHPGLADFALAIDRASRADLPPILPVDRSRPLELSFAQQRLWFLSQFEGASEAYHIAGGLRLIGDLDRLGLRLALDRIVARHEALRTTFLRIDGRPAQVIGSAQNGFQLQEHDLRRSGDAQAELRRLAAREATQPFDLEHGPLIRGRLARMGDDDHALLLTMHHIVSDGWSLGVLADELSAIYNAYSNGEAESLPDLQVQYADYAAWQRRWLTGEVWQRQADYWKGALAGAPTRLELPADRPRPAQQDYAGDVVEIELDVELTRRLRTLGQRHGTTLYMTLLSGWAALLAKLSGQAEVVIGAPVANRMRSEIEPLIGFFVNTLALRIDVSGSPTVSELLARVKIQTLKAQEHQDIPFEQVVEIIQPPRSLSHAPLFQAIFAWQNTLEGELELPGLTIAPMAAPHVTAQFDLSLLLQESGGRIVGGLEYATTLFDRATIQRYLGYWRTLLEAMVADEAQAVNHLPLLGEAERRRVLSEWNATDAEYPREKCVHELFEAQVEKNPNAIALQHEDSSLTYGGLNARANRLAHYLRDLGVGPDTRVAICVERGVEMIVALLATLKAGGAYVPLDPAYPPERMAFILEDSAPVLLLTHGAAKAALTRHSHSVPVLSLEGDEAQWAAQSDRNLHRDGDGLDPLNLAYVIYTSGSTGQPKGVLVSHRNLVHSTTARLHYYRAAITNFMLVSPFVFDSSVAGIFGTLCQGESLTLAPEKFQQDIAGFTEMLSSRGISHLLCIPTLYQALLEQLPNHHPSTLQAVIVAGESCARRLVNQHYELLPGVSLFNEYGPTEASVWSTVEECAPDAPKAPVAIGRPIANTRAYVLDEGVQPLPARIAGELCLGGEGVTRGYLNRPEVTADKFVPDPFSAQAGARLYRTGDLAQWMADGRIEFVGRNDFQVKIRGFRIELGEIEAALAAHSGVRDAVLLAREDDEGGKRLVAYYTGDDIGAEELRDHLSSGLPGYMVPSAYVRLESFPLTPSGKLDRQALPAPEAQAYVTRGYEAPTGETEGKLARIWSELLRLERVGRHDNFFEVGGHSLLATMLIVRIKQEMDVDIGLADVFNLPELALLAEHIVTVQLARFDAGHLAGIAALLGS